MIRIYSDRIVATTNSGRYEVERQKQKTRRKKKQQKTARKHTHIWQLQFEDGPFLICRACRKRKYPVRVRRSNGSRTMAPLRTRRAAVWKG